MASPRIAAPHVASPHIASPHSGPPHVASHAVEHRHGAPAFAARPTERGASRHALAPATPHAGAAVGNATNGVGGRANERHVGPAVGNATNHLHENTPTHGNAPSTVGQGPAGPGRNGVQAAQHDNRGSRMLSNPALANLSPRDPAARSLAHATFRGHFPQSRWGREFDHDHHHHFGVVLGFIGPVFWPYAYDDFVDYTFWPSAYDTFWPYAYDDVFEGMFGGYAPDYGPAYYAEGGYASEGGTRASGRGRVAALGPGGEASGPMVCSGDAQGLTDFPIQRIADQVQPDQNQQALLDQLKGATEKAVQIMQAACPTDLPATPTGRLVAMRTRIQAMLHAVEVVRPALEKFYDALNDEQKERFNALDQQNAATTTASGGRGQSNLSQLCNSRKSPVAGLPIDLIHRSLRLNDAQNADLQQLADASAKAAQILNANCPTGQPLTPPGRFAMMEQRLQTMVQAIDTVQPALERFYGSLSDEQKARFDRIGARPA